MAYRMPGRTHAGPALACRSMACPGPAFRTPGRTHAGPVCGMACNTARRAGLCRRLEVNFKPFILVTSHWQAREAAVRASCSASRPRPACAALRRPRVGLDRRRRRGGARRSRRRPTANAARHRLFGVCWRVAKDRNDSDRSCKSSTTYCLHLNLWRACWEQI